MNCAHPEHLHAAHFDLLLFFNPKQHFTQDKTSRRSGLEDVMEALGLCEGDLNEIELKLQEKFKEDSVEQDHMNIETQFRSSLKQ